MDAFADDIELVAFGDSFDAELKGSFSCEEGDCGLGDSLEEGVGD